MNEIYKIDISRELSDVYFTSDTHFGHEKIAVNRGFASAQEHDDWIIKNWNARVQPEDTVIHCGDFLVGVKDNPKSYCENILKQLNGNILLIWGNHISGVKQIYREELFRRGWSSLEAYPLTVNKLTFLGNENLFKIKLKDKTRFVFCAHFAHRIWIDSGRGVLHACGHSHGNDGGSNEDCKIARRLDVGIDKYPNLISINEFLTVMRSKSDEILDHHTKNTNPSF